MARSKQNKTQKKDGQHRAETKEEREERLRAQEEARQACFKLLPYAAGIVVLFLIMFGIYVKKVPPKAPKAKPAPLDPQFMRDMQAGLNSKLDGADIKVGPAVGDNVPPEGEAPPASEEATPPAVEEEKPQDEETVEL